MQLHYAFTSLTLTMTLARTPIALSTGLLLLLLSILLAKNPIFFLKVFLGKKDYPLNTQWASHKPFNNNRCWINTGIQGWAHDIATI